MIRGSHTILIGDALARLPDIAPGSVQTCITSPPYFAMRDYGVDGQIGCEPTPEEYIAKLVEVFRGVMAVLHDTGTLWLNIGDSYSESWKNGGMSGNKNAHSNNGKLPRTRRAWQLVAGSQMLMPHRLALAMQADGWILRSTILWSKPSPMPESVTGWRWRRCMVKVAQGSDSLEERKCQTNDRPYAALDESGKNFERGTVWQPCTGCSKCSSNNGLVLRRGKWRPTTGHEYIFLFAKSARYFCDGDAVQELAVGNARRNYRHKGALAFAAGDQHMRTKEGLGTIVAREKRNPRSVWSIGSEGSKLKHFAMYPTELVKRCLLAGTSASGCCSQCRTPYAPVVESERIATRPGNNTKIGRVSAHDDSFYQSHNGDVVGNRDPQRHIAVTRITGYRPSCKCNAGAPVPNICLDPFLGSGTTAQVAVWYGRDAIGCELNPEYAAIAEERIATMPRCLAREQKTIRRPVNKRIDEAPTLFS